MLKYIFNFCGKKQQENEEEMDHVKILNLTIYIIFCNISKLQ